MELYFPIAEISLNLLTVLGLGLIAGFASGLFGIGGGFLMTPLLIFIGVPPAVVVGTQANQLAASSVSGVITHWQRGNVDVQMGLVLLAGGMGGSFLGVQLFKYLQATGQIDVVISVCYVFFLSLIAGFMLFESAQAMRRARLSEEQKSSANSAVNRRPLAQRGFSRKLPFKMRFVHSKLHISVLLPVLIGFFVGILVAIMGVGGGFLMVPAMIYLLGMPTALVAGTSLFQILFVTGAVTIMQAITNQTVDIMLALILLLGSVVGAQVGTRYGGKLQGETTRFMLSLILLGVALMMVLKLTIPPASPYVVEVLR